MTRHHDEADEVVQSYAVHPGLVLKLDVLPAMGVTGTELARAINTPRPSVSNILNGKKPITPEMAARFEAALGYPADLMLRMQANHDLGVVRHDARERLSSIPRLLKAA